MKILILGAGGLGGYFGACLARSGADVSFLVREKRKQQLDAQGLRIESSFGNMNVHVKTMLRTDVRPEFDLVLFTCKAYDLADAIDAIAPAVGEHTVVLPVLNGVSHLDVLNQRFGSARVWGGSARVAAILQPDGVIRHLNQLRTLTFGAQRHDARTIARVQEFKDMLGKAQVEGTVSSDIVGELWMKLVLFSTLAALTSLLRANVGEINRTPEGKALFQRQLETNIQVASREGHPPTAEFIASSREFFSGDDSTSEASLARDMQRGGLIESDHILGFMLERTRAHGLPDDIASLAYTSAKAYEQRRAANRLP